MSILTIAFIVTTALQMTPPQQESEAALVAMKVSQACAEAADRTFRAAGYDKHSNEPGVSTIHTHSSHYNRELRRCLILVQSTTVTAQRSMISQMEEVFDAIERAQLGSLYTKGETRMLVKLEDGVLKSIPASAANLAWFRNLMLK